MSSIVFIHLINLNLIGLTLDSSNSQCEIICYNRGRESESVDNAEEGGRDQRKSRARARRKDSEEKPERVCVAGSRLAAWGCVC